MVDPVATTEIMDFATLYNTQWWPMVRIATGILRQRPAAEDVVQDAFAALYRRWSNLRDTRSAVGYLRMSVVNGCRSAIRHHSVVQRHLSSEQPTDADPADTELIRRSENLIVRHALGTLPDRQREVLTLSFIGELTDAEISEATGLSAGAVRSTRSRGLASLRSALEGTK